MVQTMLSKFNEKSRDTPRTLNKSTNSTLAPTTSTHSEIADLSFMLAVSKDGSISFGGFSFFFIVLILFLFAAN